MSLQDRDAMQGRRGLSLASLTGGHAWVGLLAVNVAVWAVWQAVGADAPTALTHLTASAHGVLEEGRPWTLLTSGFAHLGFLHLFWNMLFLYVFASELEAVYGGKNLVWLYAFGAVAAAACQVGADSAWGDPTRGMLGASGAVMAIAAAATLLSPRRVVQVFGVLPVPLWGLAGIYLLMDLVGLLGELDGARAGVAHAGHLGGALAGALFKALDLRLFSPRGGAAAPALGPGILDRVQRQLGSPRPAEAPLSPPALEQVEAEEIMAARVDDILRKISRDGLAALSEDERATLQEASRRYSGRHRRVASEEVSGRTD